MTILQYLKILFFISFVFLLSVKDVKAHIAPLYYNIERIVDYKWRYRQRNQWNINTWAGGRGVAHFSELWFGPRSVLDFEGSIYLFYTQKTVKYALESVHQKAETEFAQGVELELFYKFFGLHGGYQQVNEPNERLKAKYAEETSKQSNKYSPWEVALKIRALGNSLQSTHLNFLAGTRFFQVVTPENEVLKVEPLFVASTGTIYLNKNLGMLLGYRYTFRDNKKEKLLSVRDYHYHLGIFGEYRAFRMRIIWLEELISIDKINSDIKLISEDISTKKSYSITAGIQFFF